MVRRSMYCHRGLLENLTLEVEAENVDTGVEVSVDSDPEVLDLSPTISIARSKTPTSCIESPQSASASMDLSPISRFRRDLHTEVDNEDGEGINLLDIPLVPNALSSDSVPVRLTRRHAKEGNSNIRAVPARRPEESRNADSKDDDGPNREESKSLPKILISEQSPFERQQPESDTDADELVEASQHPPNSLVLPSLVDKQTEEKNETNSTVNGGSPPRKEGEGDQSKTVEGPQTPTDARTSSPRRARFEPDSVAENFRMVRSLSMTESDVGSLDGLPSKLQSRWRADNLPRENMLSRLDGLANKQAAHVDSHRITAPASSDESPQTPKSALLAWPLNLLFGADEDNNADDEAGRRRQSWRPAVDDSLGLLNCNPNCNSVTRRGVQPAVPSSLVRVKNAFNGPSFAEAHLTTTSDPRMQDWVSGKLAPREDPSKDGTFSLGKSRTVIVHEIVRGDWTWCTAWSPSGDKLAVATENHHLAVVETTASTVWRVQHDTRIEGPIKDGTTHSIRSIDWGSHFIAVGGTGNAVSILSPDAPYRPLHKIVGTGFVGSVSWRKTSNILAIGSRLEKAIIVRISEARGTTPGGGPLIESEILQTIKCKNWVNRVTFSPGGTCLAVGDAGGNMFVYKYNNRQKGAQLDLLKRFKLEDSVLDVEWSPDGKWLYAGGEDLKISIIDTSCWEIVHKLDRERWVQCISSSRTGSHIAVGGVSSEISILETQSGWDSVMGIGLKGLVPLSAQWHPRDQFLAITGQNNSILAIETTDARHVHGHHLHSVSPVLAIEFSPDGRMALVGNESGVVTMFSLSGSTFETAYELVLPLNKRLAVQWSLNGTFAVVGTEDSLVVLKKRPETKGAVFGVRHVIRDFGKTSTVAIDSQSQYVAISGDRTRILDATNNFELVRELKGGPIYDNAWSPDGRWLATMGKEKVLTIYDTGDERVDQWQSIFSLNCDFVGRALVWGPKIVGGLLYLAYGGDSNEIVVMEVRTFEGTWETVLRIPRDGPIKALDWSSEGLLAAGIGNGTVSIIDLGYLQSGIAVNEMSYNWQRQALTCFTEVRRNRGRNSMNTVKWIPSAPGSDSLLAVGGTDGELEIIDLTERRRCSGYE